MSAFTSVSTFHRLLLQFLPCFTGPAAESFLALATAWVLTVGPRTVTNLVRTMGRRRRKSHDAYQYFFSYAVWVMDEIWKTFFLLLLKSPLIPRDAAILLAGDDTLVHHSGRRIFGVGIFRDAVRSSRKHVAYACGHNWVILCVIVQVPFSAGVFLSLPICARLRVKSPKKKGRTKAAKGATTVELLGEMLALVASWAPERRFDLVADGAYACLAADLPDRVTLVSRLRKDAALYGPPPPRRPGRRGRPRTKGKRLPTPAEYAQRPGLAWKKANLTLYGDTVRRWLHRYQAFWYEVCPRTPVTIVIVRDPAGNHDDEFFFTTDPDLSAREIVLRYSRRWSQEVTHREAKQTMGIQDPQARTRGAVERQAPFALLMLSLVKLWYLTVGHRHKSLLPPRDEWYLHKTGVSFADMVRALRFATWNASISWTSALSRQHREILKPLLNALVRA